MSLDSRNLFLSGACLNTIGKAWALGFRMSFSYVFLTCSFFHQRRSPLHLSFNLSSLSFSLSSVLSNLWKSLNLCLKLYLICSSSTASLSEFIQMDKEEDAFDISAVPGGCSRSLAKSYKREVILGRVWISMHRFGLVYSHCVFETCLNICYWCMNNTAIYNSFFWAGKLSSATRRGRLPAWKLHSFWFLTRPE